VERGSRVIATVIGKRGRRVTESRLRGYRTALEDAGLRFETELVEEGRWEIAAAAGATTRLFERRSDIGGVFAQSDTMAVGVLSALRRLHKQVPGDCAVAGCDDIEMAPYTAPPLTTVHVPFYETGAEAMRQLLRMVGDPSTRPGKALLPVQLIVRGSTAQAKPETV